LASKVLAALLDGIQEVRDLLRANPTPLGNLPGRPQVVRAINRASVVLLSSHLERYVRAVNEEAVAQINQVTIGGSTLLERFRLQHSRDAIEMMLETQWDNRATQLSAFVLTDAWLWGNVPKGDLEADRLVGWLKSPSPERINRLFELWGIPDMFGKVTRRPHTRARLWLKLNELVEKRNNIAHGDATTTATYQDVASYLAAVRAFCSRADGVLARALARQLSIAKPW
jgi:hypothetical protein